MFADRVSVTAPQNDTSTRHTQLTPNEHVDPPMRGAGWRNGTAQQREIVESCEIAQIFG